MRPACPLRVLIGPILRFCTARSFMGVGAGIARPISFCAPILFFLFFEKEKNRRGVRRSQLHCASAGAAKAPYPLAPSSFPKADRCAGSPFGYY